MQRARAVDFPDAEASDLIAGFIDLVEVAQHSQLNKQRRSSPRLSRSFANCQAFSSQEDPCSIERFLPMAYAMRHMREATHRLQSASIDFN